MHCVLNYPTPDDAANLGMITGLRKHFPELLVGYSDHTLPKDMRSLEIATLLGALVLEKHFTHDKTLPGNDHYHAMDHKDLHIFRQNMERVLTLLGSTNVSALPQEDTARKQARRSLVAATSIEAGATVQFENLTFKRPAKGISPKFYEQLVGKKTRQPIEEDTVLQWNMFE
jgi:N-acetylneuraminate synthase